MSTSALIFDLPWEDILCKKVLEILSIRDIFRLKRVCKQWEEIVELYLSNFCKSVDFTSIGNKKNFNAETFSCIMSNKTNLLRINCQSCHHWLKDEHLLIVLQNNSNLMELYTPECYGLSILTFFGIGQILTNLRRLDLSYCRNLSDEALISIGTGLGKLSFIDVSGCWLIMDASIIAIAENNPDLKDMLARSCYSLTDLSISILAKNCPQLKMLDIRGCWRVKDISVITVREYCKNLKELYVKDCTNISEISLARCRPMGIKVDVEPPKELLLSYASIKMPLLQI